jgi:hypothetical protein
MAEPAEQTEIDEAAALAIATGPSDRGAGRKTT